MDWQKCLCYTLELDEWHEFDGVAYSRLTKTPTFEKMEATIANNPDFGTIWDTPVPLNELDLGNENYIETSFAIVPNPDIPDTRKINIVYTDKYTRGTPDTDLIPNVEQEENTPETPDDNPGTPFTFDNIMLYVFTGIGSVAAALVLLLARKKLGAGK